MGIADEVKGRAETLGDKAGDAFDTAKDKAEDALETVKDKAEEVLETVKDKASGIVGNVKETFGSEETPGRVDEPVEDFAAAGAPPEDALDRSAALDEAAAELERHSQPGQL